MPPRRRAGAGRLTARQLQEALALSRDTGARSAETEALSLLGELSLATGDHEQARIHFAAALALASHTGDPYWQARALDGLARSDHAAGDLAQARRPWHQALTLYTEMDAPEADQVRARLGRTQDPEPSRTQ